MAALIFVKDVKSTQKNKRKSRERIIQQTHWSFCSLRTAKISQWNAYFIMSRSTRWDMKD